MVTSRYIQLCDYLLLEYIYTSNAPDNLEYRTTPGAPGEKYAGIYRIDNLHTGEYHFVNKGEPVNGKHITGNCLDWTAVPADKTQSRWVLTNVSGSGKNPFTTPSELILEDYSSKIPEVMYDAVKLHILSGYNFEGLDGFVLEVFFKETSQKNFKAASFCFSSDLTTQKLTFNPNPIMLGEKMYDKYLEFNVPALSKIQTEYWNNPSLDTGFAYNYSHPSVPENPYPGGYVQDSPVFFKMHELVGVETIDGIDYFNQKNTYTASVLPLDTFSSLGCTIKESEDGDYFEFYPTWQNTFIDNYISNLNSTGNNAWTVINEIRVIEQIGVDLKQTAQIIQHQNSNYDTPNYYRPIIRNASVAFSFTIHYIMKFFNAATSEQIIRTSTITSYDAKKYGLGLTKINIESNIKPVNVYNKIVNLKRISNNPSSSKPMGITTKYVNTYVDRYSLALNSNSNAISNEDAVIFYGQGELTIYISKFDNIVKFKMVKISQDNYAPVNLTNTNLFVNFILDNEETLSFPIEITDADKGECLVEIPRASSQRLLKTKKDTNFYIVSQNGNESLETLMYTGKFKDTNGLTSDIYEVKKPILDYIRDKEKELNELNVVLENDKLDIENQKTDLAVKSRKLNAQYKALKQAIIELPEDMQAAILAGFPDDVQIIENPKLETGDSTSITGIGSSSSNDQPIYKDSNVFTNLKPAIVDKTNIAKQTAETESKEAQQNETINKK